MASQAYCTPPPDQPVNNPCASEGAGIIAFGFICDDAYPMTDFESNSEWTIDIGADRIFAVYDARGEYGGGDFNTSDDGFGLADEIILGGTNTITIEHRGIHEGTGGARDNITFYNTVKDQPGQYYVYWVDGDQKLWVPDKPVTVKPKAIIPKSKKEIEYFQVEVTWQSSDIPQTYDAPARSYEPA